MAMLSRPPLRLARARRRRRRATFRAARSGSLKMNIAPNLMTHRARGCPFITNVDGEDFVIDGYTKYDGYGDECKTIYFAGVALFQDEENKENGNLVFPFCFEYS